MSLRTLLDRRQRRAADVMYGEIKRRNRDGTYAVRDIRTNAEIRASKANPVDEFATGTWVQLARLGASGLAEGAGYVIISRAPQEQRGLSQIPFSEENGAARPAVLGIVPSPIVLDVAGAAVAATIYGTGLLNAPTYSNGGIVNNVAPVVTPTEITVSIKANAGTPVGDHDIIVEGRTFSRAIRVKNAASVPPALYVAGVKTVGGTPEPRIYKIDPATLAIQATYVGGGGVTGLLACGICAGAGNNIHAAFGSAQLGSVNRIVSVDRTTGDVSTSAGFAIVSEPVDELIWNGSKLVQVGVDLSAGNVEKLYSINPDGSGLSVIRGGWADALAGVLFDGMHYHIVGPSVGGKKIPADGSSETAFAAAGYRIVDAAGFFWVSDNANNRVLKVNKATLVTEANIATSNAPLGMLFVNPHLYVACASANVVNKIHTGTGVNEGSVAVGSAPRYIATDGVSFLFVLNAVAKTISRISLATFTVDATSGAISDATSVNSIIRV